MIAGTYILSGLLLLGTACLFDRGSLTAVMAYSGDRVLGAPAARPMATLRTGDEDRFAAESMLADVVRDALGDAADQVERRAVPGLAGRKLIETAQQSGARLIVLACRGGTTMLPGTISQYVVRNAPCPVLLVPQSSNM